MDGITGRDSKETNMAYLIKYRKLWRAVIPHVLKRQNIKEKNGNLIMYYRKQLKESENHSENVKKKKVLLKDLYFIAFGYIWK